MKLAHRLDYFLVRTYAGRDSSETGGDNITNIKYELVDHELKTGANPNPAKA